MLRYFKNIQCFGTMQIHPHPTAYIIMNKYPLVENHIYVPNGKFWTYQFYQTNSEIVISKIGGFATVDNRWFSNRHLVCKTLRDSEPALKCHQCCHLDSSSWRGSGAAVVPRTNCTAQCQSYVRTQQTSHGIFDFHSA